MTCPWCENDRPLLAFFGVHAVGASFPACEDMPSHYARIEKHVDGFVAARLTLIETHHDPGLGSVVWNFKFADGSVKTTHDPAVAQQWRDFYRVKEGRRYG